MDGAILANLKSLEVFSIILVLALFSVLFSYLKVNRDYEKKMQAIVVNNLLYLDSTWNMLSKLPDGKEILFCGLEQYDFSKRNHPFASMKEVQEVAKWVLNSSKDQQSCKIFDNPLDLINRVMLFDKIFNGDKLQQNPIQRFQFILEILNNPVKLLKLQEAFAVLRPSPQRLKSDIEYFSPRLISAPTVRHLNPEMDVERVLLLSKLCDDLFKYERAKNGIEDQRSDSLKKTERLITYLNSENKHRCLELVFQHGGKIIADINNAIQTSNQEDFDLPGYLSQYNNSLPQSQLSDANLDAAAVNKEKK